jgi:hypothetical protein
MKTGIITFHRANNYGCVFQAYGLQKVLETLGTEPAIIDYIGASNEPSILAPCSTYKNIIANCAQVLRYKKTTARVKGFREFRSRFLKLSADSFDSCHKMRRAGKGYDALICGSDQIWRDLGNYDWTRTYYLDFVDSTEVKRVAYAPSFGVSTISETFKQTVKPLIENIQFLSVREETGRQIIRDTTGREAEVVLDPTLLLDRNEWLSISLPARISGPYILVYTLSQKREFRDLVSHVKQKTRLPVVVISASALNLVSGADHVLYDVCPREFIGLFADASCVCTNSFHGTVFSIINRLPFWTTPHRHTNSRIADLLQRLGLPERQVVGEDSLPDAPLEIDYAKAEHLLDKERSKSVSFLRRALRGD